MAGRDLLVFGLVGAAGWILYNQVMARTSSAPAAGSSSSGDQGAAAPAQVDLFSLATAAADAAGISDQIFRALVAAESAWNPRAKSSAGAIGLTQLMPQTAAQLGVTDPYNAAQNLTGGATYLASLLAQFGDYTKALAAYNAGPGNVAKAIAANPGDWFGALAKYQSTANHLATEGYVYGILAAAPFS